MVHHAIKARMEYLPRPKRRRHQANNRQQLLGRRRQAFNRIPPLSLTRI